MPTGKQGSMLVMVVAVGAFMPAGCQRSMLVLVVAFGAFMHAGCQRSMLVIAVACGAFRIRLHYASCKGTSFVFFGNRACFLSLFFGPFVSFLLAALQRHSQNGDA